MHIDGCFLGRPCFRNIAEWLLLKDSCKDIFLLWRHVKKERIFMDFLSKSFGEKCKHTKLALHFIQKLYFNWNKNILP